jgi:hypothetical protein
MALMMMAQEQLRLKLLKHSKAKDGHGPKRSIMFLHVTGEEHGLLGSALLFGKSFIPYGEYHYR